MIFTKYTQHDMIFVLTWLTFILIRTVGHGCILNKPVDAASKHLHMTYPKEVMAEKQLHFLTIPAGQGMRCIPPGCALSVEVC